MAEIAEKPITVGRNAFLVGVHVGNDTKAEGQNLLDELAELTDTLGLPIVGRRLVKILKPQAKFYIGSGKAEELALEAKALDAGVIIIDHELSPAQQRNLEQLSGVAVIDREEVILDIFARRAQTREARLQVALAMAQYSLPRLTRAWGHLNRQQGGGLGGKGEGESQLEIDRRLTRRRIEKLREELAEVRAQRATQRKRRQRIPLPRASIVGYTNAGKSSLLRALTGAEVFIEDKLFATLDPTTRRVTLPSGQTLLLTDTVGFVRKLPHRLVEAFKATLEEAMLADFHIHVLDANDPEVFTFHRTTMDVLSELGAEAKSARSRSSTKWTSCPTPRRRHRCAGTSPDALFISTKTGEGLDELLHRCGELLADQPSVLALVLPHERGDLLPLLHRHGKVIDQRSHDDGMHLHALVPPRLREQFAPFVVEPAAEEPEEIVEPEEEAVSAK